MADWRQQRDALLLRLEHERTPAERTEAAEALCDLAASLTEGERAELIAAVPPLLTDRLEDVRCAALALGSIVLPAKEAQELLTRHITDAAPRLRVEAVGRLADLGEPSARGALAAALEDRTFPVRFEAARGMAVLKHSAGLDVLTQALSLADFRYRAAAALAQLGNRDALPALQKAFRGWLLPAFDRTQLAGALAQLGDADGVAHLFKRAGRSWSMDRAMAVEMLGQVKAQGARDRLIAIALDKNDVCRGAAARGLGSLGDPTVEPTLVQLLDEPGMADDVRLDVAEGLLRLGAASVRPKLEALRFEDPAARDELTEMLAAFPS